MKKVNFDASMLIYAIFSYMFYIIAYVFIAKSSYHAGLYIFTPSLLYSLFRLLSVRQIKQTAPAILFVGLPFLVATFLTVNNYLGAWEVVGFLPIPVLGSFSFKVEKKATILQTTMISKKVFIFLLIFLIPPIINYVKYGDILKALNLFLIIYSPAVILTTVAVFISFIIETTTINIILNNYRFFNRAANIKRILFNTPDFLNITQLNLKRIVTLEHIDKTDFVHKVEKLNDALVQSGKTLGKNSFFSHTFPEGSTLTMAPLHVMLSKKRFKKGKLLLPKDLNELSYVALAEDQQIIGYYIIDRVDKETNAALLKILHDKYNIEICLFNAPENDWENITHFDSLDDISLKQEDLIITKEPLKINHPSIPIIAQYGEENKEMSDMYIAEPFLMNILKLILISKRLPHKHTKAVVISSLPFVLPLLSSTAGVAVPQVPSIAVLFSFALTLLMVFYRNSKFN